MEFVRAEESSDYEVTVIEKEAQPACGTSYANGGNITITEALPQARPSNEYKIYEQFPKGWVTKDASAMQVEWKNSFQLHCQKGQENWQLRAEEVVRLGKRSVDKWIKLVREYPEIMRLSEFQYGNHNLIRVFTNEEDLSSDYNLLDDLNIPISKLGYDEVLNFDRIFESASVNIIGGILQPGGCINAQKFTRILAKMLKNKYEVNFVYNTEVKSFKVDDCAIKEVITNKGNFKVDQVVVATCSNLDFLSNIQDANMIQPIAGCTITVPMTVDNQLTKPVKFITEDGVIVFSPYPSSKLLRVGGLFFLVNKDVSISSDYAQYACKMLKLYLSHLFPRIYSNVIESVSNNFNEWVGIRPTTPSGLPLIGRNFYNNLYLCLGQGAGGSSYAPGCAEIIVDQMLVRKKISL